MDTAKIRLSPEEQELVATPDWILTKNRVIEKINALLASVQLSQRPLVDSCNGLPNEIKSSSPKITKGENYKGLPWLVLDYPRYFSKDDVFAIRTLFWWGNFFSVTLHLSGNYKTTYEQNLSASFDALGKAGFSLCINEDQWQHHFGDGNYVAVAKLGSHAFSERIVESSFIKLAKKIPLGEWNNVEQKLTEDFQVLIGLLEI